MTPDPTPPTARIQPHPVTQHGQTRSDDYSWLRERDNPDVLNYLQAENAYTEQMMAHTKGLQDQLFEEMKGRIPEIDMSVPEKRGDYFYYTRTEAGKQYPIYCRKHGSLDNVEEVLLDQNAEAGDQPFCTVGMFRVSPDHNWLAYSIDHSGAERFVLRFKNLQTGAVLADSIPNTYYALEWANDNCTVFYSTLDHASRPHRLHRHTLESDPATDALLCEENDEHFFLWLSKSNSDAYLFLTLRSTTTTEVHYLSANDPQGAFEVIQPRQHKVEYYVYHHSDRFLIHTNQDAPNFKLVAASVSDIAQQRELIPHRPTVYLQGLEVFANYLVRFEREGGLQRIRFTDPDGGNLREVNFPETVYGYIVDPDTHQEFKAHTLRFTYNSLITPKSVIDYDLAAGTWEIKKQQEIPSGYNASQYESQRLWATARDGAQVPLTVVYKKGLQRNGRNPTLLYAYGSYGACIDPEFNPRYLSLLDRGFVYAIAHIRGGAEMGRDWYEQGRMLNKINTFTDFIDSADYLIAQGFTAADKLAIYGVSAGGLLMGAVTNLRPDLFKAVVAKVPFVDVLNTISDPSIPLTVIEWEQWGNPAHKDGFDYMASYSPYDLVEAKAYPNLLVTAGLNDPRVAYWEPAKWTAKLRATKTDQNWLLLKTNMTAGHAGSSGPYDALHEMAFIYAFVIDRLGN